MVYLYVNMYYKVMYTIYKNTQPIFPLWLSWSISFSSRLWVTRIWNLIHHDMLIGWDLKSLGLYGWLCNVFICPLDELSSCKSRTIKSVLILLHVQLNHNGIYQMHMPIAVRRVPTCVHHSFPSPTELHHSFRSPTPTSSISKTSVAFGGTTYNPSSSGVDRMQQW